MAETTLRIRGMTCEACVRTLEGALNALPGVLRAEVSLGQGEARIESRRKMAPGHLIEAVRARGFDAEVVNGGRRRRQRPTPKGLRIAVIGAGSAAFAAALRAAEEGARVTLVEAGTVGGTCVNVGCVPSKILIAQARAAHAIAHHPFDGISRRAPQIDRARLVAETRARVTFLRREKYERLLAASPAISLVRGRARLVGPRSVEVTAEDGRRRRIDADRILIAAGAKPSLPPISGLSEVPFWTSTEALEAEPLPRDLVVLGGSAVGLEIGQAFARLGVGVRVIEVAPRLLPASEPEIGEGLAKILAAEGIGVSTGAATRRVAFQGGRFRLELETETIEAERLLVATGRRPLTDDLGLDEVGIERDSRGAIVVDARLQTSVPGIYAAGDCTALPQLVYVAAAAGTRAAVNMTGGEAELDLEALPLVVFTDPQVAEAGIGESAARARGLAVEVRTLDLENVPRALADFDTRGFVKLVAEAGSGRLLGAHVLAANAGEIIETAALAIRQGLTVSALGDTLFPYLTMAEGLRLCAQSFARDVKALSCCAG